MSTSTHFSKLYNFVNEKISQNTQFAIPPVKMNKSLQDILNLGINKSTATDNIGQKILKVSAPFIVSPLTYIFNRIIDSGIYPNISKHAKVSPIFKYTINGALTFRIFCPMLSVAVDLFMPRFKISCNDLFIFTGGIANCVF
jgi:hypothetical protein